MSKKSDQSDFQETQSQSQFQESSKKKSVAKSISNENNKKPSASKAKKQTKKQAGKKNKKKQTKEEKKKKATKGKQPSKGKGAKIQANTQQIFQYMQKQNRPYNLLNVFDNLHGSYKKPSLQMALEDLVKQQRLVAKDFGKNRIYMVNQDLFQVDKQTIQKLSNKLTEVRESCAALQQENKKICSDHKEINLKKTFSQLEQELHQTQINVRLLQKKKQRLVNEVGIKVDKEIVESIEKQQAFLRKQLMKRRKLTKQCIKTWSEIMEKKIPEMAQQMGVEI